MTDEVWKQLGRATARCCGEDNPIIGAYYDCEKCRAFVLSALCCSVEEETIQRCADFGHTLAGVVVSRALRGLPRRYSPPKEQGNE